MKLYNKTYNNSNVYIVEMPKSEIESIEFFDCGGRKTLENIYAQKGGDVIINGGYFNLTNGEPVFVYKSGGTVKMDYGNVAYYNGIGKVNGEIAAGYYLGQQFSDFITGYPCLILNSSPVDLAAFTDANVKRTTRRTALGFNDNTIYSVSVDSPGVSLAQLQQIFVGLKCTNAVNLDGGGSTRLVCGGTTYCATAANRPVANAIIFKKKAQVLYKVQVGAYSKQENAKSMLKTLKAAGYSGYVKLINGLYKVQLGAFSKRGNAEKLRDELQQKGFSAFIAKE